MPFKEWIGRSLAFENTHTNRSLIIDNAEWSVSLAFWGDSWVQLLGLPSAWRWTEFEIIGYCVFSHKKCKIKMGVVEKGKIVRIQSSCWWEGKAEELVTLGHFWRWTRVLGDKSALTILEFIWLIFERCVMSMATKTHLIVSAQSYREKSFKFGHRNWVVDLTIFCRNGKIVIWARGTIELPRCLKPAFEATTSLSRKTIVMTINFPWVGKDMHATSASAMGYRSFINTVTRYGSFLGPFYPPIPVTQL